MVASGTRAVLLAAAKVFLPGPLLRLGLSSAILRLPALLLLPPLPSAAAWRAVVVDLRRVGAWVAGPPTIRAPGCGDFAPLLELGCCCCCRCCRDAAKRGPPSPGAAPPAGLPLSSRLDPVPTNLTGVAVGHDRRWRYAAAVDLAAVMPGARGTWPTKPVPVCTRPPRHASSGKATQLPQRRRLFLDRCRLPVAMMDREEICFIRAQPTAHESDMWRGQRRLFCERYYMYSWLLHPLIGGQGTWDLWPISVQVDQIWESIPSLCMLSSCLSLDLFDRPLPPAQLSSYRFLSTTSQPAHS